MDETITYDPPITPKEPAIEEDTKDKKNAYNSFAFCDSVRDNLGEMAYTSCIQQMFFNE